MLGPVPLLGLFAIILGMAVVNQAVEDLDNDLAELDRELSEIAPLPT